MGDPKSDLTNLLASNKTTAAAMTHQEQRSPDGFRCRQCGHSCSLGGGSVRLATIASRFRCQNGQWE
jgi:hypothetical protein